MIGTQGTFTFAVGDYITSCDCWWRTSRRAGDRQTYKKDIRQAQHFWSSTTVFVIIWEATCFDLLIRSSSGLLTIESKDVIYEYMCWYPSTFTTL